MGIPSSRSTSGLCSKQVVALGHRLQVRCCKRCGVSVRTEVVIDSNHLGSNRDGASMVDVQELILVIQIINHNKTPVR